MTNKGIFSAGKKNRCFESRGISVIRKRCMFCSHHKALSKPKGIFCSRCRRKL